MADVTVVDRFPKAKFTKEDVEAFQADKLANGAKSCDLSEDAANWILTTVWPGD